LLLSIVYLEDDVVSGMFRNIGMQMPRTDGPRSVAYADIFIVRRLAPTPPLRVGVKLFFIRGTL